eukprot:GHVL01003454.1.p1 GENE.GHVL01003454.1~~GHVL01003454.1.p1  ORF type:complete len:368 (+),score=56.91 GHVL01003454.1:306-1409(+)
MPSVKRARKTTSEEAVSSDSTVSSPSTPNSPSAASSVPTSIEDIGIATCAANEETEDTYLIETSQKSKLFAVFDGHGGPMVANYLKRNILQELTLTSNDSEENISVPSRLVRAVRNLDAQILMQSETQDELLDCGSCGTLILIDFENDPPLVCAQIGDTRGILGVRDEFGRIQHLELASEHNVKHTTECLQLQHEHNTTDAVIQKDDDCPRVFGVVQCTRCFGDGYIKQLSLYNKFVNLPRAQTNRLTKLYSTPSVPWVTVEPQLDSDDLCRASFCILASDGLWDFCSPDLAVHLVDKILQEPSVPGGPSKSQRAADALLEHAIRRAVFKQFTPELTIEALKTFPAAERRKIFDDVTCLIIKFGHRV